ncbi:MAG: N-acetylneuraminate synthase family protein [Candidatus Paceibacterota bacterium]|jgi:sialic acid synthase SpsE
MAKDIILGKVGNKKIIIGPGREPLLIAEAGVLTWGEVKRGYIFVDEAKKAGLKLIKFQAFNADHVVSKSDSFWHNRLKQRELSKENFFKIKNYAESKGLLAFATTHNEYDLVNFAKDGMAVLKIGSGDSNNFRMIDLALETGKPVIVSLGLMDEKETEIVLKKYRKHADKIVFMYCVTLYPTPPEAVDLSILGRWRKKYPEYNFGYSDHVLGKEVAVAAVMNGASIIEKHLCLPADRVKPKHKSYDIIVALIPDEMKKLNEDIKNVNTTGGQSFVRVHRVPSKLVKKNILWARKSITAFSAIKKGTKIKAKQLVSCRPFDSRKGHISIEFFDDLVGTTAVHDIVAGSFITKDDIFGFSKK